MKKRHPAYWPCVVAVSVLMVGMATVAPAYTRPTTKPPTPADLLLCSGDSHTLGVVVLNLTPYRMSQPDRNTMDDQTNTDRGSKKSFMFAPVGVPGDGLPALDGTWGADPGNSSCKVFTPSPNNHSLHPYPMAFSFAERGGTVKEGHHTIRLEDVWEDGCHEANKQHVDVGLFFSRIDPDKGLKSEVFKEIVSAVTFILDTIGLVVEPENPLAWYDWFVATMELKNSSFELQNAIDDNTTQAYFAAYPWPDAGSAADVGNGSPSVITYCSKCGAGETSDGIDAEWGEGTGGTFAANIVVTTHLLRGNDDAEPQTGSIAFVTLWPSEMYTAAQAGMATSALKEDPIGRRIHSELARHDPKKVFGFAHLVGSLTPEELATYRETYRALRGHHRLSDEQKALLERLAVAFEKGHTSLERVGTDDPPSHERPGHDRPAHDHHGEASHESH